VSIIIPYILNKLLLIIKIYNFTNKAVQQRNYLMPKKKKSSVREQTLNSYWIDHDFCIEPRTSGNQHSVLTTCRKRETRCSDVQLHLMVPTEWTPHPSAFLLCYAERWRLSWSPEGCIFRILLAVPGHALLWPFPVTDWMISLRYVPRRLCPFPQE
jgi:hypothetical protein